MKIGGFEVGEYAVKEEAGKRHLIFDCRDCVYRSTVAGDHHCRYHVIKALAELEADDVVLADVYERVYSKEQTKELSQIGQLMNKFEAEQLWSPKNLSKQEIVCEKFLGTRHDAIVNITHELIGFDPILAYLSLLQEFKKTAVNQEKANEMEKQCFPEYMQTLLYAKQEFEKTLLIQKAKEFLLKLSEIPETSDVYRTFFEADVKPSFIGSRLMFEKEEKLELLDQYSVKDSNVEIYKHPNKVQNLYFINPPEYTLPPEKYFVLSKTKEIVATYKPGKTSLSTIAKSRAYFSRVYEATITDIARENSIKLSREEVKELAQIVARYTIGYGILEILLSDRKLTDIYLDSPIGGKALYVVHSDFGQCETNVIYTETEASALVSKLRAMSGRPFDESHPVLDFDLEELETRIAVIGKPLSPDGTAFAFRLHKMTPWTLPQFIDVSYFSPLAAGLLSFFVDSQATMLITGSRGSGKTSLIQSLVLEIVQSSRIIVQEDTLEIPVTYMKDIGFNIQRLKTRSPIGVSESDSEVGPAEALRTALRLGDSALIIGEVRSKEAKVLYEAMRIGAAGSTVMGTIHADSAYSVWDRVVNDLGVPNTSFKATDIVVVARPIRFLGALERHRRVVQVTEIKKHWTKDPEEENALLNIMSYDAKKDQLILEEDDLKKSELFDKISKLTGLSMQKIWNNIRMNAESKAYMVELKRKHEFPLLLEAENSVIANNKLLLLREEQLQEHGEVDYEQVLIEWKKWTRNEFLKRLMARGTE
jgi:archaeal flagellar protein FlaI